MIRGVLLDVDGVLTVDGRAVPGAAEAVAQLRRSHRVALLTNGTLASRRELAGRLSALGLPVSPEEILTPARLASERLAGRRLAAFVDPAILEDLPAPAPDPEIVLLGDLGERFDYALLQRAFEHLLAGAELWALHKAAYWRKDGRIRLDLGPFVAALEHAAGREAVVLGKPSREAFLGGCARLGLAPGEVAMVGDDVRSDVGAALACGLSGVLVRTGKFREDLVASSGIVPVAVLDSIADLPRWLDAAE